MTEKNYISGACGCGELRYRTDAKPFIVHCCHCSYYQRQTGSAFVINALVLASSVELLSGELEAVITPSPSGKGQKISRCTNCKVAVWSNYFMGGIRDGIHFIRVGTLDLPDTFPPDVHIFTETKQKWVTLDQNAVVYERFYDYESTWSKEDNDLRKSMLLSVSKK